MINLNEIIKEEYAVLTLNGTKSVLAALKEALSLLRGFKSGGCFCEVGIGNPNYSSHTKHCDEVKEWFKKWSFE